MDQTNNEELMKQDQPRSVIIKSLTIPFLKKLIQVLLSVSVFSFIFSYTSSSCCSFNICFNSFPFKLITHNLDKNFTFLICNGILVLLAKTSGFVSTSSSSSSPAFDFKELFAKKITGEGLPLQTETQKVSDDSLIEKEDLVENPDSTKPVLFAEERALVLLEEKEEGKREGLVEEENAGTVAERDIADNEGPHREAAIEDDDEGFIGEGNEEDRFQEDENGFLSTEELNKKFDEFIRKMKEELRFEARRQLVMV